MEIFDKDDTISEMKGSVKCVINRTSMMIREGRRTRPLLPVDYDVEFRNFIPGGSGADVLIVLKNEKTMVNTIP